MAGERLYRIQERTESFRLRQATFIFLVKSNCYRYVSVMCKGMLANIRTDRRRFPKRNGPDQGAGGSSSFDESTGRGWHDQRDYHHVSASHSAFGPLGRTMADCELRDRFVNAMADRCHRKHRWASSCARSHLMFRYPINTSASASTLSRSSRFPLVHPVPMDQQVQSILRRKCRRRKRPVWASRSMRRLRSFDFIGRP